MRKYLALLTLGALALGATQAFAQSNLTYADERVVWRTNTNTSGSGSDIARGYMDSMTVSNAGTATTAASVGDTTAPIVLFQPPPIGRNQSAAGAVDSAAWFTFRFVPKSGSSVTITADSIYLATQVSYDGKNWQEVTATQAFFPANQMPTSVQTISMALLEQASSNGFYYQAMFVWAALGKINAPASGATTAPTAVQLGTYRYIRFIVVGDWGGEYEAYVWGPRTPPALLHTGN